MVGDVGSYPYSDGDADVDGDTVSSTVFTPTCTMMTDNMSIPYTWTPNSSSPPSSQSGLATRQYEVVPTPGGMPPNGMHSQ